jgi:transcriptional regulator with XRE-family HTH domain
MPTRDGARTRGTDRGLAIIQSLMRDAQAARVASGLSYAAIGRALHLAPGQVAGILRGKVTSLTIVRAAQILAAVGMKLSASGFPEGPAVRDAGQRSLLDRLRRRTSSELRWSEEVPVIELPTAGEIDLRAWDAGIDGSSCRCRVDAESHVGDLQAVTRRVALKQRDGRETCVILLLADTKHHRALLELARDGLRAQFPTSQRTALAALKAGRSPGGNSLILL